MLSICIPVYNVDVRELVAALIKQATEIKLTIEILAFDDGSSTEINYINREIAHLSGVIYNELKQNIGRAAIRNRMARAANYNNLLFIDSDSAIHENFLYNYRKIINQHLIVCGGREHPKLLPGNQYTLRWTFGRAREDLNAASRSAKQNIGFISNNFMVKKSFFEQLCFNEEITEYGHEDTMLGIEMDKLNIQVHHINNPVIHIGLETNATFLEKTKTAQKTLLFLYYKEHKNKLLFKHVKLLYYFRSIALFKLTPLIVIAFNIFEKRMVCNLTSESPNLFLFDFYKLGYFSKLFLNTHK